MNKGRDNIYIRAIKEIRFILSFNSIIQLIFTLGLVFISTYTVLFFFRFYPIMISSIITFFVFLYKINEVHADYVLMQRKYPKIADAIQAFKDTINEEGYLVQKLREDVIRRLKEVRNGDFFDYKSLFKKAFLVIVVFSLLMVITVTNVNFPIHNKLSSLSFKIPVINIFDEKTDVQNKLIKLNSANDNMKFTFKKKYDLSLEQNIEEKNFDENSVPIIEIGSDDIYVEQISNNEKSIVKKYFENINN